MVEKSSATVFCKNTFNFGVKQFTLGLLDTWMA